MMGVTGIEKLGKHKLWIILRRGNMQELLGDNLHDFRHRIVMKLSGFGGVQVNRDASSHHFSCRLHEIRVRISYACAMLAQ